MRILYQSMTPVSHLKNYAESIQSHARISCAPDTQVDLNGLPAELFEGTSPTEVYGYPYLKYKICSSVFDIGRRAQAEGYDAYVLGSFSEPFLPELRSLLSIPVTSMVEASVMLGCAFAEKIAFVSLTRGTARRLRGVIRKHGVSERIAGFHSLAQPIEENELNAAFKDPSEVVARFMEAAERAIGDEADLVIPAEGVINEVLFQAGVHEIDRVTVFDCVGATLTYAEALVNLSKRSQIKIGRRWASQQPSAELLERVDRIVPGPAALAFRSDSR